MRQSNKLFKLAVLASASSIASATVYAQEQGATPREENIIITGSHIRSTGFEGRAPVQVIDAEAIELIGASQPAEILKDLTVNSGSQLYNETNNRGGTVQFNVRNLGIGSTLTLLNGRRAGIAPVTDDSGADFVDINQFPLAMIERIEVLTDGASATYGSQAVAGVANIITRKGFEGFEVSGGYSTSQIDTWHVNLATGARHDKGNFNLYATYYGQGRADRTQLEWLVERIDGDGDLRNSRLLSSTGSPGTYQRATLNAFGEAQSVSQARNNPDPDCEAAGGVRRTATDSSCRYPFADQVSVISAEQRAQAFSEFDWQFNDTITYYAEASYSHNVVRRSDGGGTFNTGSAVGGGITIPSDHPFNFFIENPSDPRGLTYIGPANWNPAVHTAATLRCICRPFGADVNGPGNPLRQDIRRQFEYVRFVNGFEIELPGNWYADMSYAWSHATRTSDSAHNYRSDVFNQLVKDGEWNPFGTRLSNPTLVSPKDPTKVAGNDEITRLKFDERAVDTSRTQEHVVDGVASGSLFESDMGVVAGAFGAQYRKNYYNGIPDSLGAAGESNEESTSGTVKGDEEVWAVFAETIVPVTDVAEIQLAIRREDYGGRIGATTDPKISAEITPTDWLGIRGSWGTSFQAPTVRQTASATSSAFIDDPASPTGPGGSTVCVSTGLSNNIVVSVQGSPDLQPQSSKNFNAGVVIRTEGGLNISVDYWNFNYKDLIAQSEGAQAIVNNDCADDGIPNDPRVIRDAGGQLRQVNTEFTNIGRVKTDGLDIAVNYTTDVGDIGTLVFNGKATYVNKFNVDGDGDGTTEFDGAGSRNFTNNFSTMPEWRGNAGVTLLSGMHSVNATVRYIDGYTNDQSNDAPVESMTTVDLQYAVTIGELFGDNDTVLTIGANNVFDVDPPALRTADGSGNIIPQRNPDGSYNINWIDRPSYDDRAGHDIRGRILYVRAKQTF